MNIFERASRLKLRYNTVKGDIGIEDLWDLPLQNNNGFNLDAIAISLNNHLASKKDSVLSFVNKSRTIAEDLDMLRFEIVKHIIEVRIEEKDAREQKVINDAKKTRILNIIARKDEEALEGMSKEDLIKMVNEM